jgi:hypothetical protein
MRWTGYQSETLLARQAIFRNFISPAGFSMSQGTKGASRKYVCLEVDAAIYGQAKAFELPISHIVDEALGRAVHLAANRETIRRNLEKEARERSSKCKRIHREARKPDGRSREYVLAADA